MRLAIPALLTALVVLTRVNTAEACACCDAKFSRTPVGWNSEGALMIDTGDTIACEVKRRLEIWAVDAKEPSGCFDLFGDPEKQISCAELTSASARQRARTSSQKKSFVKSQATKLAASKVRVTHKWGDADSEDLLVTVEVKTKTGWKVGWSGAAQPLRDDKPKLSVSVWPTTKGDRALVLIGYRTPGTGNERVDVRWATL